MTNLGALNDEIEKALRGIECQAVKHRPEDEIRSLTRELIKGRGVRWNNKQVLDFFASHERHIVKDELERQRRKILVRV